MIEPLAEYDSETTISEGNMLPDFTRCTQKQGYEFNGGCEYSYSGVSASGYEEYARALERLGYTKYQENKISENIFSTYIKGDGQVSLAYYPSLEISRYDYPLKPDGHHDYTRPQVVETVRDSALKAVASARGYLPSGEAPSYARLCEPTVTQMKQMGIGMSYIVQLADGSFVMIDGGLGLEGAAEYQLEFLEAHKPMEHKKPRIAAWFFTHAHPDHVIVPVQLLERYGERLDVSLFAYNFIDEASEYAQGFRDGGGKWTLRLQDMIRNSSADELILHAGQVVRLAGCDVHILHTHEDIYPTRVGTLNGTSSVFKLVFKDAGRESSLMVVGDITETNAAFINAAFDSSTLKSDILQVAHHGENASYGTQHLREFYVSVSPKTALFSNYEKRIAEAAFLPNAELNGAEHIYSDEENTVHIF